MDTFNVQMHSRFRYLLPGLARYASSISHSAPDKAMFMFGKHYDVYWEYHDGVRDAVPRESTWRLYSVLRAANPQKPWVYVKPNLSKSTGFLALAAERGGHVVTCPKWSYYPAYESIIGNRKALRSNRSVAGPVMFAGSLREQSHENELFFGHPFEHGVAVADAVRERASNLPLPASVVTRPTRADQLASLRKRMPVEHVDGLSPDAYIKKLLACEATFQPHGVGIRHGLYEAMALGVPSILPASSYIDASQRAGSFVVADDEALTGIDVLALPSSDAVIEVFESSMLPDRIVDIAMSAAKSQSNLPENDSCAWVKRHTAGYNYFRMDGPYTR